MLYQKPTKVVSYSYTTTDIDNGYRIICNASYNIVITLHTPTDRKNFELEVDNIGTGTVTINNRILKQYTHAHIGNDGTNWSVVLGGGEELSGLVSSHYHIKPSLSIGENYTTKDADNGYRILKLTSGTSTITLHDANIDFFELEINNLGTGSLIIGDTILQPNSYAYVIKIYSNDWRIMAINPPDNSGSNSELLFDGGESEDSINSVTITGLLDGGNA